MRILLTGNSCFKIANFREGLVRALVSRGHEVVVLAPIDSNREKLIGLGCRVLDLRMERNGLSPLAEFVLLLKIYCQLRIERPDFVFSYTIKNNIYAGLACRLLGICFVPNVTGLGPAFNNSGLLNQIIRTLYRVAFANAQKVFFQNPDDQKEFLRARLVQMDCCQLLPGSGVDLARYSRVALPAGDSQLVFLLVARLLWDKGVGLYVDAAKLIRAQNPLHKFQVLGPIDSHSRSSISINQIQSWVDAGFIEYLGEASDVRPFFSEAHCIVLPTWYREGTPKVLLEAAAMGRPVITTNTPGCREAVIDGKTGFLAEARSLESLIEVLDQFISMTHQEREIMGGFARVRAEKKFDEAHVINAYLDLLPPP